MSNVINLFGDSKKSKKKPQNAEEKLERLKESMTSIIERNLDNEERMKLERARKNELVKRSYRLKSSTTKK